MNCAALHNTVYCAVRELHYQLGLGKQPQHSTNHSVVVGYCTVSIPYSKLTITRWKSTAGLTLTIVSSVVPWMFKPPSEAPRSRTQYSNAVALITVLYCSCSDLRILSSDDLSWLKVFTHTQPYSTVRYCTCTEHSADREGCSP
jgi:hypothetical protein